jgi:hypothetical protein
MKLRELLTVIPDNYILGLMNADEDNYSILVFGRRKDVIWDYGQRAFLSPDEVLNLNVEAIHPGVNTYLRDSDMYGEDSTELHVKTQLLIELKPEEEEK